MTSSANATDGAFPILLTCAGRRVALIRAFAEALAELDLTGPLVATDVTTAAAALHVVDEAAIVPPVGSADYIDHLLDLARRHAIRLVVPLTDLDLVLLASNAGRFAELGCTVMIGPERIVRTCRDKIAFHALLSDAGLPSIRTLSLAAFRAAPFYPCFVKPVSGSSAVGTRRIADEGELAAHVAVFGEELMVQDVVDGSEYTLDVLRRRDGVVVAVVPRQRLEVRAGEVARGVTVNAPALIDAAERLVDHLPGLWGAFNIQCRRPAGGEPYIFELNPRFGGGVPLSIAAGVPLPRLLIEDLLGRAPEARVGRSTDGLLMLRYDDAVFTTVDDPRRLPGYDRPLTR
ncbi:MAG: ATP-grasp domain-containing protein [Planctomycetota bacterium]